MLLPLMSFTLAAIVIPSTAALDGNHQAPFNHLPPLSTSLNIQGFEPNDAPPYGRDKSVLDDLVEHDGDEHEHEDEQDEEREGDAEDAFDKDHEFEDDEEYTIEEAMEEIQEADPEVGQALAQLGKVDPEAQAEMIDYIYYLYDEYEIEEEESEDESQTYSKAEEELYALGRAEVLSRIQVAGIAAQVRAGKTKRTVLTKAVEDLFTKVIASREAEIALYQEEVEELRAELKTLASKRKQAVAQRVSELLHEDIGDW